MEVIQDTRRVKLKLPNTKPLLLFSHKKNHQLLCWEQDRTHSYLEEVAARWESWRRQRPGRPYHCWWWTRKRKTGGWPGGRAPTPPAWPVAGRSGQWHMLCWWSPGLDWGLCCCCCWSPKTLLLGHSQGQEVCIVKCKITQNAAWKSIHEKPFMIWYKSVRRSSKTIIENKENLITNLERILRAMCFALYGLNTP